MKKEELGRKIYRRRRQLLFKPSEVFLICFIVVCAMMILQAIFK